MKDDGTDGSRLAATVLASPGAGQSRQSRAAGVALMLASSTSNQTGAAAGALAFPEIGPVGVIAIRQVVTALVLTPIVRPRLRSLTGHQIRPIIALALVFSVMNVSLYAAVERVGLAMAVTLEFLGPLAVAIGSSRRSRDMCAAVLAGAGVLVLTHPGVNTDVLGVGLALIAAASWASYILLNRAVGARVEGLHGTAVASLVAAACWVPVGASWFAAHPPTPRAIAYAAACGVLASVIPYVTDLMALRRVPTHVFGIFASMNPVCAAVAGTVVLGQIPSIPEWAGIAMIVGSNVLVTVMASDTGSHDGGSQEARPRRYRTL
ncbi:EamA family transporter [Mycolicibacterium sediminis]|nr:EamA family transporter [Mycolicibacterium sediminis]